MADSSPRSGPSRPGGDDDPDVVVGVVDPADLAKAVRRAVTRALAEDLGDRGDVTGRATIPAGMTAEAEIVAREPGWVSGLDAVLETFAAVDARTTVDLHVANGDHVIADQVLATVSGPARGILAGERTALNFLGRLSGIATATATLQDLLEGTGCQVRDTRKTTPGLRLLEKAAVADGGGNNHRIGLYDAVLVKENHILAAGGVERAVEALRAADPEVPIQVEVDDLDQLARMLDLGVTDILLDNFSVEEVRHAAARVDGRAGLEVSGNLDASTIRAYAEAVGPGGRLAVGAITHSAPSLDIALDVITTQAVVPLVRPPTASTSTPPVPAPVEPAGADAGAGPWADDLGPRAEADAPPASPAASPLGAGGEAPDHDGPAPVDDEVAIEASPDLLSKAPLRRRVSSFFGREDSEDSAEEGPAEEGPADEDVDFESALAGVLEGSSAPASDDDGVTDVPAAGFDDLAGHLPVDEQQVGAADEADEDSDDQAIDLDALAPPTGAPVDAVEDDTGREASSPEASSPEASSPEALSPEAEESSVDPSAQDGPPSGGGDDVEPFERREIAPLFGAAEGGTTDYTAVEAKGEPFSWRTPREG